MLLSFAPIALLVLLLFSAVQLFGADASYGPNQVALLIASACAGLVGMYRGMSWAEVQDSMVDGIKVGLGPILILLAVGGLCCCCRFRRSSSTALGKEQEVHLDVLYLLVSFSGVSVPERSSCNESNQKSSLGAHAQLAAAGEQRRR